MWGLNENFGQARGQYSLNTLMKYCTLRQLRRLPGLGWVVYSGTVSSLRRFEFPCKTRLKIYLYSGPGWLIWGMQDPGPPWFRRGPRNRTTRSQSVGLAGDVWIWFWKLLFVITPILCSSPRRCYSGRRKNLNQIFKLICDIRKCSRKAQIQYLSNIL